MEIKNKAVSKTLSVLSIVVIVLLLLILLNNIIFIVAGALDPDGLPTAFGVTPLLVLSGSMEGDEEDAFPEGSIIFLLEPKDLEEGDVITFYDPSSTKKSMVTHRIVEIIEENGSVLYQTQGDVNNTEDKHLVGTGNVIGELWFSVPTLGYVIHFMQQPLGMLLCIGVPVIAFVLWDFFFGRKTDKKDKNEDKKDGEGEEEKTDPETPDEAVKE